MACLVGALAAQTSIDDDDVWLVDSTPVECGRSEVTTVHGLPLGWALTGAKADEREALDQILATTPVLAHRRGRLGRRPVLAGKNYYGRLGAPVLRAHGHDYCGSLGICQLGSVRPVVAGCCEVLGSRGTGA